MKDKVFIAWSGSNKVAMKIKDIFESKHRYICYIGGNADNESRFASIGDTVIQQMKSCNQAIIIFQNRNDGQVSNNLFFELGYVFATYGPKKVHCVKRAHEEVVLPSDFDNSFVESIECDGGEDGDLKFAQGVVKYFIGRQRMSINENKMFLINNRYLIHDKIVSHYSESGSKCSDYELAQYILFYIQGAHMFGDEKKVQKELEDFKKQHNFEFSAELSLAVNLGLSFFNMITNIKSDAMTAQDYIDVSIFWEISKEYAHYKETIKDDDLGIFDEWYNLFISEHMAFAYMLFANNPENDEKMKISLYKKANDVARAALGDMEILEERAPCKENNDEIGLLALFKAYLYRNIFIGKEYLHEADAIDWLKKTLKVRAALKNTFARGTIDTLLYNNLCMEYYLSLSCCLNYAGEMGWEDFEVEMYKREIKDYLSSVQHKDRKNIYVEQIERSLTQVD